MKEASRQRSWGAESRVVEWLLMLVVALWPWGPLASVASGGEGRGTNVTLVLGIGIIALAVMTGRITRAMARFPFAVLGFLGFLILSGVATLPLTTEFMPSASSWVRMTGYFLLALSVAGFERSNSQDLRLLKVFVLSTALMSTLAIADYFFLIDVPGFNAYSRTVWGDGSASVLDLSGPFESRTVMAVHLALAFPIPLVLFLSAPEHRLRWLWGAVGILLLLSAGLTFSRGLLLSLAGVVGYVVFSMRARPITLARALVVGAMLVVVSGWVLTQLDRDLAIALGARVSSLRPTELASTGGDMVRVLSAVETVSDLSEAPWGVGFTRIEFDGLGRLNPHNNLVTVLRAAGPIGFILLLIAVWPLLSRAYRLKDVRLELPLFASLISLGAYGLTHNTLATLLGWIFVGLALSRRTPDASHP